MQEPLVPAGNALRPRSLIYLALGFCALIVTMASDGHWQLSVPFGLLAALVASFGALDFTGCFDTGKAIELGRTPLLALRPRLLELGGCVLACVIALRLAVSGALPAHAWLSPILVTLTALASVLSLGRLVSAFGNGDWQAQPGFWLLLLGVGLYVPLAGCYSLLDPWETHYGEVTREMLARDDWLSLWWGQEGWFWSKPILDFWLQGLCFALLGVKFRPDEMLGSAAHGYLPQPEWAARLPVVLFALLAVLSLYRFVARAAGKRVGFLAGLVLLCAPYWSLLAHQSMTDMPYVAPLTVALSMFGLALLSDAEELTPGVELPLFGRRFELSAFHGLFALILLSVVPQLAYLISRNVTLQLVAPPYGFRWHLDEFFSGSGLGNCGLPGNEPCRSAEPANNLFQPLLGATIFGAAAGYLLYLNRAERRKKRLYYIAAWYFTALATLGKGAPGFVLPVVIAAAVLSTRRDWRELTRIELASFGLVMAAVCLPWYVQAYMRHGEPFTDRLLFHDMYKRAFEHVHDTNSGTDVSLRYYLWQLGYGLFPWSALAPLGLGIALEHSGGTDTRRRDLALLICLWLVLAFALFTLSLTKFHHYALPCAPPLAVAVALALDRALGAEQLPAGRRGALCLLGLALAAALLVLGAMRFRDGGVIGRSIENLAQPGAAPRVAGLLLLAALGVAFASTRLLDQPAKTHESDARWGVWGLGAAAFTLLIGRDLSTSLAGDVPGSARLLHLVTYNYKRLWPPTLDFEAVQWGFGLATSLCLLSWLVPRWRFTGALLLAGVGAWFCAFTLWIYLPELAPHFGQRELLLTYYRSRHGPEEPIVAYQMNWKGENFYTGNHLPAFVSTGAKFEKWLKAQRRTPARVVYFLTEHGRIGTLKSELGPVADFVRLTDARLNNKFALVRVKLTAAPSPEAPDRPK